MPIDPRMMAMFMQQGPGMVTPISDNPATPPQIPVLQITPQIQARFERRIRNAGSDQEMQQIVKDAAKYGMDWSELLR